MNLIDLVRDFQNDCDECNCDYDCILKEWNDDTSYFILDGYGMMYVTDIHKWNSRNKKFFDNAYVWVRNYMHDNSYNIFSTNM